MRNTQINVNMMPYRSLHSAIDSCRSVHLFDVPGAYVRFRESMTASETLPRPDSHSYFGTLDVENRVYHNISYTSGGYTALATQGGQLYAAHGQVIYTLNKSDATPTYYGRVQALLTGTAFDSNGTFSAVDAVESMFGTISSPPTVFTPIGKIINEPAPFDTGSLAYLDGDYYETRTGWSTAQTKLMLINPGTGEGAVLSNDPLFGFMPIFTYEGRLLGVSSLGASFAHLFEIDTKTFALTDLGEITGNVMPDPTKVAQFTGVVDVAVPEPSTFLLLGAGVGCLLFWRRRS